jgi:dTDP-4-dehydrorhamnose 3,5-epimerase-like enzyme/dTDP-4-dehydrorhamnose reductase
MYQDSRGYLIFPIKNEKYMDGSKNISKECTYSVNKKNVFRGLHINTFGKLITCISGSFIDIMVNLETLEVQYFDLKPGVQVYCPAHFGHGFISLEENSVLSYHCEGIFGDEIGGLLNYKDPVLNIKLPVPHSDIIINEKDSTAPFLNFEYFLLGKDGYIGGHIYNELLKQRKKVLVLKERMCNLQEIKNKIEIYKPKYFINAAGLTGIPNTIWCNEHRLETLITNVVEQINILNICHENSVHCTLLGSAAIFKNRDTPINSNDVGDLDDINNYYSHCRILLEEQIKVFNNCLLLRINYPISSNMSNCKNLIKKLLNYEQIEKINLSITNLDSMCPLIPKLIENNETGIVNFVNKGQMNMINLIIDYSNKFNYALNKTFINNNRDSPEIYPDRLDNETYLVENIDKSIENLFETIKTNLEAIDNTK